MTLVLVGPRAVGKSTLGQRIAASLGRVFVDTDDAIAQEVAAESAGAFLARVGEPAFREVEERVVLRELGPAGRVVALGGGAVTIAAVRARLAAPELFVVFLEADTATLEARLRADPTSRPALTDRPLGDEVRMLWRERLPLYREVADRTVDVTADGGDPDRLAAAIEREFLTVTPVVEERARDWSKQESERGWP